MVITQPNANGGGAKVPLPRYGAYHPLEWRSAAKWQTVFGSTTRSTVENKNKPAQFEYALGKIWN